MSELTSFNYSYVLHRNIKSIEFVNKSTNCKFIIHTTTETNSNIDTYEFCLDKRVLCCEVVGWVHDFYDSNNIRKTFFEPETLPNISNEFINEKIEKINFYETTDLNDIYELYEDNNICKSGCAIVMEIICENGRTFNIKYYSFQNGYYNHDVWLDITNGSNIINTMNTMNTKLGFNTSI